MRWRGAKEANASLVQQFADLGYVEDPNESQEKRAESPEDERDYNLARVFLSSARAEKAVPLLEALLEKNPWDTDYMSMLARALLMQMLEAGGIPAMTDGARVADEDNPEGYLEWEGVKKLPRHPEIFDDPALEGKAVKVISMLLQALPPEHCYKVLFSERDPGEVFRSQEKMKDRLGTGGGEGSEEMREKLGQHQKGVLVFLEKHPSFELLRLPFSKTVADPAWAAEKIGGFIGERFGDKEAAAACVRADLYRNKLGG